jgi:hypothetical protein
MLSMRARKYVLATAAALFVAFVAIQFVPAHRTNRLGTGDPQASREVQWILRRACYDCHSTETRWPIWAYVAPVSWQVVKDVERARKMVNFSDWASYSPEVQGALKATIAYSTSTHRMPTWYYVTLHPDAKLQPADYAALAAWAKSPGGTDTARGRAR